MLGVVVAHAEAAVIEEVSECIPSLEAIGDSLCDGRFGRELFAFGSEPGFESMDNQL
jgi:hypothetical protein